MKRLYIAIALLVSVATSCVLTHLYQHRQMDRMLTTLDRIEAAYRSGDADGAVTVAEDFAAEYQRICDRISCYVAHNELRESRETAALLPTLLREHSEEEIYMEIARLRAQLTFVRQVDDPLLQNIL
ncbi:MAG: DUF4363 family protein [Clostridia bacterium]|nr:DUF4363 family protein [Clostridia bacterium]